MQPGFAIRLPRLLHAWEHTVRGRRAGSAVLVRGARGARGGGAAGPCGAGRAAGAGMARDGAQLAGLHLLGGALLLKVEWAGMAAQMRVLGAATLDPAADRLLLCRPYELSLHARMTRMADVKAHLARALGKRRAGSGRRTTTTRCFPPWMGRLPDARPAT